MQDLNFPYLTVLIPTYNEEKNIQSTIQKISEELDKQGYSFEILVVDDASIDKTVQLIHNIMKEDHRIRLVSHSKNRGPGSGIITGIENSSGEFIIFIPADLAMDICNLSRYLAASKNADVIVGLRSDRRDYSLFRKLISHINIYLIQFLFAMPYKQFNYISMYRKKIFKHFHVRSRSVFVTAEIMIKARDAGFKLEEIEVGYIPRKFGKASGANLKSILKTARDMFTMWLSLQRCKVVQR